MESSSQLHSAKRFRPAGQVTGARFLPGKPDFIKRGRSTGRFAVGLRYERQVHDYLSLLALGMPEIVYREGPWIQFWSGRTSRYCQPDALMIDKVNKAVIVYEIKYQHCIEAWFQLRELYFPVVARLFPDHTIGLMEIAHWHDPGVVFPQKYSFTESPLRVPKAHEVAVCVWNPKRRDRGRILEAGHSDGQGSGQAFSGFRA